MSRSQRSQSHRNKITTRLAQTQPNAEPTFNLDENTGENDLRFLDTEQKSEMIKKLVIYILQNSTVKTPIKRADIIKHVLNGQSSLFSELFGHARRKLRTVYGIGMVEAASPNIYMCIKTFPTASLLFLNEEGQKRFSLLFLIISYVYMKGGKITHSNLKEYLGSFDIYFDTVHDTFGNVKKLLEEFIRQLYLKKTVTKVESLPEEVIEYSWGERSELEFDKKVVLNKVADLLKKPVECFMEQYSKAYENDGSIDASMDVSQEADSDE